MKKIIVGMSGASGVIYGIRTLMHLRAMDGVETHLVLSKGALTNIRIETDYEVKAVEALADAHRRLTEGQGAELLWRDSRSKRLKAIDALKIYALKTAPAFEAAIMTGMRLAGPTDDYQVPVKQFARSLGVAFQILNDLNDWRMDQDNKLSQGGDILGGRPTVLWALALEELSPEKQQQLQEMIEDESLPAPQRISRVRQLYHDARVFDKACRLVDKYEMRAEEVADQLQPPELQRLFRYLIEVVLERPDEHEFGKPTPEVTTIGS